MTLSTALLTVAEVNQQLAYASQAIGALSVIKKTQSPLVSQRAEWMRASITMDGLAVSELMPQLSPLYDQLGNLTLNSEHSLTNTHRSLLAHAASAGQYRNTGMGVYRNNRLVHMTAPANQVAKLIRQCLNADDERHHPLLRAANVLFDLEFIQPFAQANGIVARLWHKASLIQWQPLLLDVPIEKHLLQQQENYYAILKQAIANNDNHRFIAFILQLIGDAVATAIAETPNITTSKSSEKNTANISEHAALLGSEKLATRDKLLLLLERQPTWSAARAADVLGISSRAVEKHLARLKRDGLIQRHGSARSGRWQVTHSLSQQLSLPEY